MAYLAISASIAALPALLTMLATGDYATGWRVFFGVWLAVVVIGAIAALFGRSEDDKLDESGDINEMSYQIRSIFGKAAQAEFLAAVACDADPGKNTTYRKFAPGQNHKTMAAKAQEIRGKYKPVGEYKPNYEVFG